MSTQPQGLNDWPSLSAALGRLRAKWPSRGWSWDRRLNCVTSSFSKEDEAAARAAASEALLVEWTPATVARAPARLRELVVQCGDLRSGQLLFTGGPIEGLFAFGLWWPWGNGDTISLRVGLAFVDVMDEQSERFRSIFGASLD